MGIACRRLILHIFMKFFLAAKFSPVAAALVLGLVTAGCTHDFAYSDPPPARRTIPLAPVGAASPGIGGPGGNSADTRATGTVASGQGDAPIGVTDPAEAPIVAPGVAPGSGTAGVHSGGRY